MEEDLEDHEDMDVMGCEVTGIAIGDGDGDGDGWVMAVRWLWPSGMDGQWMGEWRRLAEVVARRERDTMSFVAHFAFRMRGSPAACGARPVDAGGPASATHRTHERDGPQRHWLPPPRLG